MTSAPAGIAAAAPRLKAWRWLAPFALAAALLRLWPAPELTAAAGAVESGGVRPTAAAYAVAQEVLSRSGGAAKADALPPEWRGSRHILPLDIGPAPAAYRIMGRTSLDRGRALSCLANAIYYEAGNEPEEGQRAVAQVVLNRLRHAQWPNSVCGVVYEGTERTDLGCQFTFSCDGAMARSPERTRWMRAFRIAGEALAGRSFAPAGLATFYHTLAVRPAWSARLTPVAIIGAHIFYRMPGGGSDPAQYRDSYTGTETISGPSINAFVRPQAAPPLDPALVAPVPVPPAAAMPASPALPTAPPSAAAIDPGRVQLPVSGIRPEYQASGRVLD